MFPFFSAVVYSIHRLLKSGLETERFIAKPLSFDPIATILLFCCMF